MLESPISLKHQINYTEAALIRLLGRSDAPMRFDHSPAAYAIIEGYLKNGVLHDLWDVKTPIVGGETRSLMVQYRHEKSSHTLPFETLSDGEKCFFICALVLAANAAYGPIFCFWDEPDSHLAIDEVGHFITALRRSFENRGGQVLMTSHNSETIRRFSDENTMVLLRESHLEPTRVKTLEAGAPSARGTGGARSTTSPSSSRTWSRNGTRPRTARADPNVAPRVASEWHPTKTAVSPYGGGLGDGPS